MQFTEEQTALLKTWAIKKLEDISDADADVLADYAIALVSTEDAEEVAKANCVESLNDFLPGQAEHFVDELFEAIANKSYDPSQPQPKLAAAAPRLAQGSKSIDLGPLNESRKRSFQWDADAPSVRNGHVSGSDRPIKQMRRGGRGGFERGGRHQQGGIPQFAPQQFSQQSPMPNLSGPPNLPPFDPNDAMQMMAIQQFMNGMSGYPGAGSPQNAMPFRPPGLGQRCRDYDTKGFCSAGASCPYEHGNDRFIIPSQNQEYDPANATLNLPSTKNGGYHAFNERGRGGMRGRGRGTTNFRGGKRSDFSQLGPNRDSNNTSVVVEQIPDDKLNDSAVHDFFSEFGGIEDITLHPDRKLAVLKFTSKASAKAAYDSPKVIFDNRFVKVYWYNSEKFEQESSGAAPATRHIKFGDVDMEAEEQIDPAELAKRQEEAQRKHEEARKQRENTEKQKASLDHKLKEMEAERKKMADRLAKKTGMAPSSAAASPKQNGHDEESEQTKGLRAQLATLEAEAKELGIDPDAAMSNGNGYDGYSPSSYRGRGGYRGRARGRGYYQPYRGGWAGAPAARSGAVKRLDNRPKTIAVTFANDQSYDTNDESLRQFLLFNSMETSSLVKHGDKENTALVTFNQRYEGENFMRAAAAGIPHAGKVETSWHSGPTGVKTETVVNGTHDEHWNGKIEAGSDAGDREMYDNEETEEQDLDRYA